MPAQMHLQQINRYFSYLFDDYGFTVSEVQDYASFGNWMVLLTSDKCRIRFIEDRGQVTISLGPVSNAPNLNIDAWFDLQVVTAYLNQNKFRWDYAIGDTELQFVRLATTLHPYLDRIIELFTTKSIDEYETALHHLWAEHWSKYLNPPKSV